ncbi:HGxxPAAW family protein [Streptomyces virginiae]|uniref:HGxxPAAW family protein n=1 Tax=Streptomyces virginiae TaxID=1961 RepID=UPI0037019AC7
MSAHGHVDLGHTVAGWTGTTLALLGFAGAGVALCTGWAPGILIGLGVVVLAGLVTWLLHLAGWGKPSGPRPEAEWAWRVRDPAARTGHAGCLGCRVAGPRRAVGAAAGYRSPALLPVAEEGALTP